MKDLFNNGINKETSYSRAGTLLEKEGIQHREIAMMRLAGSSPTEIAAKLGYSYSQVVKVLAQPFVKEFMLSMLHEKGEVEVEKMLQTCAKDAVEVLSTLAKEAKSESVRANAAFALLRSAVGTKIKVTNEPKSLDAINAEEERLKNEISMLRGDN